MIRLVLAAMFLVLPAGAHAERVPSSAAEMQLSFVPLVKQATPAVVNIYAKVLRQPRSTPLQRDPFFERFFRRPGTERPQVQNSLGSGVILSPDGIVVSNYHVVGMATEINVVLADRREFSARVLLGDAENDLAILQLDGAADLPHLSLRASDTVEVGELALAIGNPFGVGQTVSSGIISGLARSGAAEGAGRGYFVQTDAPINPGNSGGALIDMTGHLIGINTSILTRSGGSNGIGFAIPADLVGAFVAQARAGKTEFGSPWAGMAGQPVDNDIAEAFGLDRPGGIIVSGLHPESPLAKAKVDIGDVIVAVNGQPVNTPSEMVYRMSVTGLGNSARVTVMRGGAPREVDVLLMEAPDNPPRDTLTLGRAELLEGTVLMRVNPAVMSEFNLPLDTEGVLVAEAGRLGARVGLRPGDIIEAVNDRAVEHPQDVAQAFADQLRGYVLTVQRGAQRVSLRFGR